MLHLPLRYASDMPCHILQLAFPASLPALPACVPHVRVSSFLCSCLPPCCVWTQSGPCSPPPSAIWQRWHCNLLALMALQRMSSQNALAHISSLPASLPVLLVPTPSCLSSSYINTVLVPAPHQLDPIWTLWPSPEGFIPTCPSSTSCLHPPCLRVLLHHPVYPMLLFVIYPPA